jgi:hypothetical protein
LKGGNLGITDDEVSGRRPAPQGIAGENPLSARKFVLAEERAGRCVSAPTKAESSRELNEVVESVIAVRRPGSATADKAQEVLGTDSGKLVG